MSKKSHSLPWENHPSQYVTSEHDQTCGAFQKGSNPCGCRYCRVCDLFGEGSDEGRPKKKEVERPVDVQPTLFD